MSKTVREHLGSYASKASSDLQPWSCGKH